MGFQGIRWGGHDLQTLERLSFCLVLVSLVWCHWVMPCFGRVVYIMILSVVGFHFVTKQSILYLDFFPAHIILPSFNTVHKNSHLILKPLIQKYQNVSLLYSKETPSLSLRRGSSYRSPPSLSSSSPRWP